jgi:4a-hydroxytetrahydrobiopterin dehydratase
MSTASAEELRGKSCVPCEGGVPKYSPSQAEAQLSKLSGWRLSGNGDRVCDLAEAEQHHPDLHLTGYRNVVVELMTHAIGGLSENDFILAAKVDALPIDGKAKIG